MPTPQRLQSWLFQGKAHDYGIDLPPESLVFYTRASVNTISTRFDEDDLNMPTRQQRDASSTPTEPNTTEPRKSRARWGRRLLILAGLFAVLVFIAPIIVAKTSLKQSLAQWALSDFNGSVTVKSASFNWFSPIQITGVQLSDSEGKPLVELASVTTSRPLMAFLYSEELGTITLDQPRLYLAVRSGGSNLEDAFAKYLEPSEEPSRPLPVATIKITNGACATYSTETEQTWNVEKLDALIQTSNAEEAVLAEANCEFHHNGKSFGGLAMVVNLLADDSSQFTKIASTVNAKNIPLGLLEPVLNRSFGPTRLFGYLTGEFSAGASLTQSDLSIQTKSLSVNQGSFASPAILGADTLNFEQLTANGILHLTDTLVEAKDFTIDSDLANGNVNGIFDLQELTSAIANRTLPKTPFQLDGKVDVAKVAATLPNTLQLHKNLKVDSGLVQFHASMKPETGRPRLVFNLDTANLQAQRNGQPIRWQKPIRLSGVVQATGQNVAVESLTCESDFLEIEGQGTLDSGSCKILGDLQKLTQSLGQFVELGETEIAGQLDGSLNWKQANTAGATDPNNPKSLAVQLTGSANINRPVFASPSIPKWSPPQMDANWDLLLIAQESGALQIPAGTLVAAIGTERLQAKVSKPIADALANEDWQFIVNITGDAGRLLDVVQNFAPLGDVQAGGQAQLDCLATINSNLLRLNQIKYSINQFAFDGYTLTLRENQLVGNGNLRYEFNSGICKIANLVANAQSIRARTKEFEVEIGKYLLYRGDIEFTGQLDKIANYWLLSPDRDSIFWLGQVTGVAKLNSNPNGELRIAASGDINNFAAATITRVAPQPGVQTAGAQWAWERLWQEKKLTLHSDLNLSPDYNQLAVRSLELQGESLDAHLQGKIDDLMGQQHLQLTGDWSPKWDVLNRVLEKQAGKLVAFAGKQPQKISISGPLFPPTANSNPDHWLPSQLQVSTGVAWEEANVLKFPIGQHTVGVNLNNSIVQLDVNNLVIADGQISLQPKLMLIGKSPTLVVDQGMALRNLNLDAATCRQYLKYLAPLAADATSAQGKFSISTSGIEVPLYEPERLKAGGAIRLEKVTIGAGPLADQLLSSVQQVQAMLDPDAKSRDNSTWLKLRQQDIPFAIQDGRIYHRDLSLEYRDITITTRGSVGLDQTINMVAQIPVLDRWVVGKKWFEGMRGQSISLPITGTLSKPVIDKRALQQLSMQIARSTAGSALNDVIKDKLNVDPNNLTGELQNKVNEKANELQNKVQNKLENELLNGLDNLFKKRK